MITKCRYGRCIEIVRDCVVCINQRIAVGEPSDTLHGEGLTHIGSRHRFASIAYARPLEIDLRIMAANV